MGISHEDHAAFWSVACQSGASYQIEIDADEVGTARAMDCSLILYLTKVNGFVKLKD